MLNRAAFILVSKYNWFCINYAIGLKKETAPLFHPIRNEIKTNRELFAFVSPRFASDKCNYFKPWLVHWIVNAL